MNDKSDGEKDPSVELDAEKILKSADFGELQRLEVPEWGGHVFVKVMSGAERDRFELKVQASMDNQSQANVRAALCASAMCSKDGKRLFTDNQVAALGAKSGVALDRVFAVARRVNKVSDDDLKELEKN